MKKITRTVYVATDGKEFDTAAKCKRYEADGCVELKPLPDYGGHMSLTEQKLRCYLGGDGDCYYATATKLSRVRAHGAPHPEWATHLIYFGK